MKDIKSSEHGKVTGPESVPDHYVIDPLNEKLLSLREAVELKWLPKGRAGSQIAVSTLYRWSRDGRLGVKLPILDGPVLSTSEGAIRWAYLRVNYVANARRCRGSAAPSLTTSSPGRRERASRTLDAAGV